jgi:hypothetical protein
MNIRILAAAVAILLGGALGYVSHAADINAMLGDVPNDSLTPGETLDQPKEVLCDPAKVEGSRVVTEAMRRQILQAYGYPSDSVSVPQTEVDHRIPVSLNGASTVKNLWYQDGTKSRKWRYQLKDRLETKVHRLYCQGQIDLPSAQAYFTGDWREGYKHFFGEPH